LAGVFLRNRGRILATYSLFCVENLLRVAQPFVLGLAITGALAGSFAGLFWLVAQHAVYLLVSAARRMYDTRAFTITWTDLACRLVQEQRQAGVDVSRLTARTTLARGLVDFYEHDALFAIQTAYSVVGALVMLCREDWLVAVGCLVFLVPA